MSDDKLQLPARKEPVSAEKLLEYATNNFIVNSHSAHGGGRTTEMHNAILQIVKAYRGGTILKIFVLGATANTTKNINQLGILDMLSKNNIICKSRGNKITTNHVEITFKSAEMQKGAQVGMHPDPLRFVDHYAQEVLISKGLQRIKSDLDVLNRGW